MGEPRDAMTAAVVGDALAEDCPVYQRFSPNRESRRIAANIVRLPELLGAAQPEGNPLVQRRP
jgi:hypothetical protein